MKKALFFSALFLSMVLVFPVSPSDHPAGQRTLPPNLTVQALQPSGPAQRPAPVADSNFGRLPVDFIANQGQLDERVAFYIQGKEKTIYFTSDGVTMALGSGSDRWAVKLDFVDANPDVQPVGLEKTVAVVSYFKGKRGEWRTGLPTYSKIVYSGLWPGIDLVYAGTVNRLKYEFVVHPGADPSRIKLAYRGAEKVSITADGRLEVSTPLERFQDDVPVAYQESDGHRAEVALAYRLDDPPAASVEGDVCAAESKGLVCTYRFDVGEYDPTLPLILDPAVIVYCGYIGGSGSDNAYQIAVDSSGNAYLAGRTSSSEASFPVTVGPDSTFAGSGDVFVAKVNPSGTALVYCGYIGGSDADLGQGIAVDGDGNAYVTGYTFSTESSFPVITGPDLVFNGVDDCFVAKVNASGTALVYCGYIGGAGYDEANDIAVDGAGNAYVCGVTESTQATFPVLAGPDVTHNGIYDAFVAKVNASGSSLGYCGYIGGSSNDWGYGVAVDSAGNAYVTGHSSSSEATFPCIEGPDLSYNGGLDAFVAKVGASGTLAYCGYIGGSSDESGYDVAFDGSGSAYVAGYTKSGEGTFPVLGGPDLSYNGGLWDGFVAKVNPSGSALVYCGYIGGSDIDFVETIAANPSGSAFVVGVTGSSEASFPVSGGPDLSFNGGAYDAFVAKVKPSGLALDYCGYIGGSMMDVGKGIALDGAGNAYVTGYADSTETSFPVAVGPFLTHSGGYEDAFVAKLVEIPIWHARHAVGDFDGDSSDEAAVDFGTTGIFMYDGGAWTQLSAANPESLVAADVDGDSVDELLADLGTSGLWLWNAGAWNQISGVNVEGLAAGDVDGDGADDELVCDFGPVGMWLYNSGAWSQLSGVDADYADCAYMDGDEFEEIVGDFGAFGLWLHSLSYSGWWPISAVDADYVTFGTLGAQTEQLPIGDFGETGLWICSLGNYTQLSGLDADYMVFLQADSGDSELIVDFGAVGLWFWSGGASWTQWSGADAEFMIVADTDGNGTDEGGVDFGALGLWLKDFTGGWTQLSGVNPEYLVAGDFDGDIADEMMVDFGTLGLWLWNGGAWSQISALNPE